ncbi:MAG: hypothetical protein DMF88_07610 [Acidobacteria bacterium]|nr:MAG: hypothetical protein DMF88_07610 [Acidobacteriota bacterium]
MLQAFVITLREGLEAFLIVAISLAYLRKSGRAELTRAVHLGIVAALAVSGVGGYLLYNASNQELLEGPLALVAAISVAWLVIHMWRAGRHIKGDIEQKLASSSVKAGAGAFAGVFLFTVLMVSREGMETALLLLQLKETLHLALGATLGVIGAATVAFPGDGDLPVRLRRAAADCQRARDVRAEHDGRAQPANSRCHRVVGTRQRVRACADLRTGTAAGRVARLQGAHRRHLSQNGTAHGRRALTYT